MPLQEMATSVTYATLELIGVSAVKSGNVLIINGEQVAVGRAAVNHQDIIELRRGALARLSILLDQSHGYAAFLESVRQADPDSGRAVG